MEMELELANEVYVFYDKRMPGFKFYDRTPEPGSIEGRLTGVPPEGVYYTEKVETANWDDEINKPNETVPVRYIDGTNQVTTIMVTVEEMGELLRRLEEAENSKVDGKMRIDLRIRQKEVEKISSKDISYCSIENNINKSELYNWKSFLNENLKGKEFNDETKEEQ